MENLEKARKTAVDILKERKKEMTTKANQKTNEQQFIVEDVVYLYRPVVTPGKHRMSLRPWVEQFYIAEKLSDIFGDGTRDLPLINANFLDHYHTQVVSNKLNRLTIRGEKPIHICLQF